MYANIKPDYADQSLKPNYADVTCPKHDNADHHYTPINVVYTPLVWKAIKHTVLLTLLASIHIKIAKLALKNWKISIQRQFSFSVYT